MGGRGFTLVELLVSIAIILVVTSIVLVRYSAFDSTVLLKGTAYEIAMALREAQIRSLSQVRSDASQESFNYPYGISFTPLQKSYTAFLYSNAAPTALPRYDTADSASELISTLAIGRTMQVSDVCITTASGEDCGPARLDVSFKRPDFKALFYAANASGGEYTPSASIVGAVIKVNSTQNTGEIFNVVVTQFGQMSVVKQ